MASLRKYWDVDEVRPGAGKVSTRLYVNDIKGVLAERRNFMQPMAAEQLFACR